MESHIAFVGPMHSGKTTAAKMLVDLNHRRVSFAEPVKRVACDMINTFISGVGGNDHYTVERLEREKDTTAIRTILQVVGTELGRNWRDENTWVSLLRKTFWSNPYIDYVCDDCRFPNEYQALKELGFTTVRLKRNESDRLESIRKKILEQNPFIDAEEVQERLEKVLSHPSETSLPEERYPCDVVIYADTPEELLRGIEQQVLRGQQRLL